MILTVVVTVFLLMSALCTAVLIGACVVSKRADQIVGDTELFALQEMPAEHLATRPANQHQPVHASPSAQALGKA